MSDLPLHLAQELIPGVPSADHIEMVVDGLEREIGAASKKASPLKKPVVIVILEDHVERGSFTVEYAAATLGKRHGIKGLQLELDESRMFNVNNGRLGPQSGNMEILGVLSKNSGHQVKTVDYVPDPDKMARLFAAQQKNPTQANVDAFFTHIRETMSERNAGIAKKILEYPASSIVVLGVFHADVVKLLKQEESVVTVAVNASQIDNKNVASYLASAQQCGALDAVNYAYDSAQCHQHVLPYRVPNDQGSLTTTVAIVNQLVTRLPALENTK